MRGLLRSWRKREGVERYRGIAERQGNRRKIKELQQQAAWEWWLEQHQDWVQRERKSTEHWRRWLWRVNPDLARRLKEDEGWP